MKRVSAHPVINRGAFKPWLSHLGACFLLPLLVYLWSTPRSVVLEDDGLFIMAAYFNSFAHPPGYPLYCLFASLVAKVPLGTVAFRVHMTTALFAGLACAALWWLVHILTMERFAAYLAALALAVSLTFWSQAIIAEVYTLNVLVFLVLACLCVHYARQREPRGKGPVYVMAFIYGLGLSNHWPLLLLSSPALLVLAWPAYKDLLRRPVGIITFLFLGLLPYLWMMLRSQTGTDIVFFGPLQDFPDLWSYISREGYQNTDHSASSTLLDKMHFLGFFFGECRRQFGTVGGFFVLAGFVVQWQRLRIRTALALVLAFAGSSIVLIFLLGFDFDPIWQAVFRVYPLVPYTVMAVWLAIGFIFFRDHLTRITNFRRPVCSVLLIVLVLGTAFPLSLAANFRRNDTWMEDHMRFVLSVLPPHALLITNGDWETLPAGYLHKVAGVRPDIKVYNVQGVLFPEQPNYAQRGTATSEILLVDYIRAIDRPVYFLSRPPGDLGALEFELFRRYDPALAKKTHALRYEPVFQDYLRALLANKTPVDVWQQIYFRSILAGYCRYQAIDFVIANRGFGLPDIPPVCRTFVGWLEYTEAMLNQDPLHVAGIVSLLQRVQRHRGDALTKASAAKPDYYAGMLNLKLGNYPLARRDFERSLGYWPDPRNPSYQALQQLGERRQ